MTVHPSHLYIIKMVNFKMAVSTLWAYKDASFLYSNVLLQVNPKLVYMYKSAITIVDNFVNFYSCHCKNVAVQSACTFPHSISANN